ncbi:MAG: DNA-3-methyladenine glycosylase family protein [Planctomycetaceae bacterium]
MGQKTEETDRLLRALKRRDPILSRVIRQVGEYGLKPRGRGFEVLVQSIISQQISTSAAQTIQHRLRDLVPGKRLSPEALASLTDEQLRGVGVSPQKLSYVRDLTRCALERVIDFRRIARGDDETSIGELVQVRGIGRWTAQMYLMFSLGRPDVFAVDDLGLRNAMQRLYGIAADAKPVVYEQQAELWRPARSIASWYLWRSLEISAE